MKKADKAALLQQFASLAGLAPEEITAQITALNPALSEKDVKELVAELTKPAPPAAGSQGTGGAPPIQDPKPPAPENKNRKFDEYRVEPNYKRHEKSRSNPNAWNELTGFTKIQKIKTVAITPDRAALLNEQSESSLIRYYDSETELAAGEEKSK